MALDKVKQTSRIQKLDPGLIDKELVTSDLTAISMACGNDKLIQLHFATLQLDGETNLYYCIKLYFLSYVTTHHLDNNAVDTR